MAKKYVLPRVMHPEDMRVAMMATTRLWSAGFYELDDTFRRITCQYGILRPYVVGTHHEQRLKEDYAYGYITVWEGRIDDYRRVNLYRCEYIRIFGYLYEGRFGFDGEVTRYVRVTPMKASKVLVRAPKDMAKAKPKVPAPKTGREKLLLRMRAEGMLPVKKRRV